MPHSPYTLTNDSELVTHGAVALDHLRALTSGPSKLDIAGFKLSLNEPARAIVSDEYEHYELEWNGSYWLDFASGKRFRA